MILLYGSVIFLGFFSFNPKASMAVSEKMNSASENLNEKSDAQMGNSEEERMCEKILENEPRNVEALKVVVYGKMRRGKNKAALEFVQRLIEIEPNEVEWKLLQALCYELMGQLSTAKRLFKEILKERPLLLRALHVWLFSLSIFVAFLIVGSSLCNCAMYMICFFCLFRTYKGLQIKFL